MPRVIAAALPFLVMLSLSLRTVAGPPEKAAGKMVLDKVADGLRRYRTEKDPEKRTEWLKKLAPSKDPRVAVTLGETNYGEHPDGGIVAIAAIDLLADHFVRGTRFHKRGCFDIVGWWRENEADLRRRAKQLPE